MQYIILKVLIGFKHISVRLQGLYFGYIAFEFRLLKLNYITYHVI